MTDTILVADDDREFLRLLVLLLRGVGYTVLDAPDGEMALAIAEDYRPNLIVSDVRMPRLTGDELATRLRGRPDGYAPPIVLISGSSTPSPHPHTTFLPKPFSAARLLREVAIFLPRCPARPVTARSR